MVSAILESPGARERVLPLSVRAYHDLAERGLISEKAELLRGVIFEKMPKSRFHVRLVRFLEALLRQQLPGMTSFALESAGGNVGFVRARTWVGWDIRIEDERNRPVARISKSWEGLDRAAFPTADNYVVQIHTALPQPLNALVVASALSVDTALKQDSRVTHLL